MQKHPLRSFEERTYDSIPLDRIVVLNSRNRSQTQFQENVDSIQAVGLLKPIVVNRRIFKKTGNYELVCGEGRYLAYKKLGLTHIPAEIIDCDEKEALLYSLVENIARVTPNTMWFAREIKRMFDAGWSLAQIGKVAGKGEAYVCDFIRLVEKGEERLIRGVEQGVFPISFALQVAKSSNADVQDLLMQAFDSKLINTGNMQIVRKIIEHRFHLGKDVEKKNRGRSYKKLSLTELREEISKVTNEKESHVHEGNNKENRIYTLIAGIESLWKNDDLVAILKEEGLDKAPTLEGHYDTQPPSPFCKIQSQQ